jgi:hypothetical protein
MLPDPTMDAESEVREHSDDYVTTFFEPETRCSSTIIAPGAYSYSSCRKRDCARYPGRRGRVMEREAGGRTCCIFYRVGVGVL